MNTVKRYVIVGVCLLIAWILVANVATFFILDGRLASDLHGTHGEFHGVIAGTKSSGVRTNHYPFDLQTINGQTLQKPIRVRLSLSKDHPQVFPGNKINGYGRLEQPEQARNPGGFDYESYLMSRGKHLVLYPRYLEVSDTRFHPLRFGAMISHRMKDTYIRGLPSDVYPWIIGMTLGDLSYLDETSRGVLDGAGARHLVAVSGLHVSIVAMGLYSLLLAAGVKKKLCVGLALMVLFMYASASGMSPSVMRASFMITLVLIAKLFGTRVHPLAALLAASVLLISFSPYLVYNVGFQLSVMATLSIIILYPKLSRISEDKVSEKGMVAYLFEPIKVAFSALVGILPLLLYHFGWLSFGSLLIAPAVAFVMGPLLFMAILYGVVGVILTPLTLLISIMTHYLILVMELASSISPQLSGHWSVLEVTAYYGVIVGVTYLKRFPLVIRPVRWALVGILLSFFVLVFSCFYPYLKPDQLIVYYLDVGQGDAIAIFTPGGKTILVDGGGVPEERGLRDPGESVLMPFFRHYGIDTIDLVFVTHHHTDHIGGLTYVFDHMNVSLVMLPDLAHDTREYYNLMGAIADENIPTMVVREPRTVLIDEEVVLEIMHPTSPYLVGTRCDLNNNSIVFRLVWGEISLLFTGDLEQEGELRVLKGEHEVESLVLKVGHHGSRSSTTDKFLSEVDPVVAVIPVGRNNIYGHPADEVIQRLKAQQVHIFRTDLHGAVKLKSDGETLELLPQIP